MPRSVAIRLGTEGKAQVKADFVEIGDTGDATAKRWSRSFESATKDVEAAMQRQSNAAAKLAMIQPQSATQMRINDANSTGFGQYEGSARQSAAAFRELIAVQEQMEVRSRALVAAIDPAFAAQQRFDREMMEARTLISAGAISLDQYVAKLRIEQGALDAATAAKRRANVSTGEFRAGSQQLSYQIGDVTASLASGSSVTTVFAQQIGQTVQAVQLMTGATSGFLGFMAGPWGAVITGGVVLLTNLAASYFEAKKKADATTDAMVVQAGSVQALDAVNKLLNDTLGQSAKTQGQVRAEAIGVANANLIAAEAARQRALQEINLAKALLAQTQARSRMGGERSDVAAMGLSGDAAAIVKMNTDLIALEAKIGNVRRGRDRLVTEDNRIRATETADRVDGEAKLLAAAGETGKAERSLAAIRKEGREQLAKGTLTEDAYRQRVTAGEKALDAAREADKKGSTAHAQSLARQASAMNVNAQASLDLATAYLVGGDAAIRAEAARKGLTDATRKGIDGDAQTARQLQVMIGEQVANGAKSVAQLREEAEARKGVLAQVAAGTLPIDGMNRALSDEAALRPLLKLQTLAQGDALKVLNQVISDYRDALKEAHEQETNFGLEKAISDSVSRVDELKSSIADINLTPLDSALNAAKRAAVRDADAQQYTGPKRDTFIDSRVAEAEQQYYANRSRYVVDSLRGQQDSLVLAQRELQLVGANDNVRSAELEKLKLALDIRRRFPDMAEADVNALLRGVDAQAAINHQLDLASAAMDELRGFGGEFVDTVLSPDTWSSWGNAGKTVTNMLRSELLKLALINPLKNLINGDSKLPTLFSSVSKLAGLFGGKSAATSLTPVGTSGLLSGNASGTEWWSGGMMLAGENGAEIITAPRGSRVTNAGETRRLFAGNDNPNASVTHNHFSGNLMTPEFWERINAGDAGAAMQGAAGGAAMSQADATRASVRRLGRFR